MNATGHSGAEGMKRLALIGVVLATLAGIGWLAAQRLGPEPPADTLYGNVEIRQADLAFNAEGRVLSMPKQEGDRVQAGEVIAPLDPATYEDAMKLVTARREAAQAALDELVHGTRPEDIDQARANVAAAKAAPGQRRGDLQPSASSRGSARLDTAGAG